MDQSTILSIITDIRYRDWKLKYDNSIVMGGRHAFGLRIDIPTPWTGYGGTYRFLHAIEADRIVEPMDVVREVYFTCRLADQELSRESLSYQGKKITRKSLI